MVYSVHLSGLNIGLGNIDMVISTDLMAMIRNGFALRLDGIHGEAHWGRVHENGLRLAEQTGADIEVVELFAFLHDSKRQNDGWDQDHGQRAAEFVRSLSQTLVVLPPPRFERLVYAIARHSDGLIEADVTIQTCWDADRLDLGRIGIQPDPKYLCTDVARDPAVIEWALRRSAAGTLE
jgi:uncharacterized protein